MPQIIARTCAIVTWSSQFADGGRLHTPNEPESVDATRALALNILNRYSVCHSTQIYYVVQSPAQNSAAMSVKKVM